MSRLFACSNLENQISTKFCLKHLCNSFLSSSKSEKGRGKVRIKIKTSMIFRLNHYRKSLHHIHKSCFTQSNSTLHQTLANAFILTKKSLLSCLPAFPILQGITWALHELINQLTDISLITLCNRAHRDGYSLSGIHVVNTSIFGHI
eukprot:Sdes_comp20381_c0_seq1m14260